MDARARVRAAIARQPVDQVPCGEILIEDALLKEVLGCETISAQERIRAAHELKLDAVCLWPNFPRRAGALPDPSSVGWPDAARWRSESDAFIFLAMEGVAGWGTRLLGWQGFLLSAGRHNPDFIELAQSVATFNLALLDAAAASGAMAILLADDIAYNRGPLLPPDLLRFAVLPGMAALTARAAELGLPVFFHSDGNITALIPELVAAGFAGMQCLESGAGVDLRAAHTQFGDRLCFWGNLGLDALLPPFTPNRVAELVDRTLPETGDRLGLIFGTSSGLTSGILLDNLRAAYAAARVP